MGRKPGSKNKKTLELNNEMKKTLTKPAKPFNFFVAQVKKEEEVEEAIDQVLDEILPQPKLNVKACSKPLQTLVKEEPEDIKEEPLAVKNEEKSQASDHSSGYESPSEHDSSDNDEDWKPAVKGKHRAKARTYGSSSTSTYRAISKPPTDDLTRPKNEPISPGTQMQKLFNIQALNSLFKPQNQPQLKALTAKIAFNNAAKAAELGLKNLSQYQDAKPQPIEGVTHFSNLQDIKPKPPPIMYQAATKVLIQDLIKLDLLTNKSAKPAPCSIKAEDHQNSLIVRQDLKISPEIIAFPHSICPEILVEKSAQQSQRMLENLNSQSQQVFEQLEQSGLAE